MGPLYMGENLEEVDVVWDTGSDWLVVASYECSTCNHTNYDFSSESSFTDLGDAMELVYGSAYCEGYNATDDVCTVSNDSTSCVSMEWMVMDYQEGFDGTSGIAGLSTGLGNWETGPLVIQELYAANKITDDVFAFWLGGEDENSYLDIGTILDDGMRDPDELVWLDVVEDDFWWTNYITGLRTTSVDGEVLEYAIDTSYGMTDTGTSCIYVPTDFYNSFMNMVFDG